MRLVARQVVTAVVFTAPAGDCDLSGCFRQVGHGPGLLIVDGVLSVDVRVGDRTATEIVGDGDVLQPLAARADDMLERTSAWHALMPARLALPLTHRLLGRLVGAERPSVSHALSRLAQAGLVTSRDGALQLHGTADEHLVALFHRPSERRESETDAAVGA